MAAPQNHWKLGLFVVVGGVLALASVIVLGAFSMYREVGLYTSYFDESVQGLEVGSPIKFRGVTIGTVGRIDVAPDHRHVEVESELGLEALTRLGLDIAVKPVPFIVPRKLEMAPDLRLQLASTGLTGVKFLQLDFFDVLAYPPPQLPFPVPENYIPTAPSMMKGLEDSINAIATRLPAITEQVGSIAAEINIIVREIGERKIPEQIAATLDTIDGLFDTAQQKVAAVDTGGISKDARRTLGGIIAAVGRVDGILVRVEREDGLLPTVERAGSKIGDILRDADGLGGELVGTLVAVQSALRSIRLLVDALEQDPEMLVKGRSKETKR